MDITLDYIKSNFDKFNLKYFNDELDYKDYSVGLKDMITECAKFMDLDVVNWRKANIEL